ncbi:flagellar biosynthesis protein FlhF [Anaerovirgula multivorans]|uniref:Flagellar biosynthesis protein FlhF n=1 Tax=Anaerovirgula multivorans TaxID=312168 RepID=A0A239A2Y7_9FIRM|nr:flagellar biosynthesis protein FlhF [Anaerovirgula multivorans]SNR89478.1 flagellar biosynthesis protein FlhF [Anaerovirgula multivorans]
MKVKKFSANNNQEALSMVRNELGPDAVILYQKKVKAKGLFGFLKKPIIEVVAAKEDRVIKKPEKTSESYQSAMELIQKKVESSKQDKVTTTTINSEVNEIKNMLNTVIKKMNKQELPDMLKTTENKEVLKLFNLLKEQELEEALIEEIINKCITVDNDKPGMIQDKQLLELEMKKVIDKYIVLQQKNHSTKIMVFIGPTGVGKTTTIAKLAAQFALNEGKTVGLISADTYRIAAVEQLRTYSDILNVPLEVIYDSSEIHYAINQMNEKDIIMVDTAGRSHKDKQQVMELEKLLEEINEKDIYLVMSCTSKYSDIKEIVNTYNFIDNYNIIFTKIDEATTYGTILNTAKETRRPISYITTGQSVPDDIEVVSIEKIVSLLIREAIH